MAEIKEGARVRVVPNRYGKEVPHNGEEGVVADVALNTVASVRMDSGRRFLIALEFLEEVADEEADRG